MSIGLLSSLVFTPPTQRDFHPRESGGVDRGAVCYRPTCCRYARIGCPWRGPFHEVKGHEETCIHPKKTGDEVMNALVNMDQRQLEEKQLYSTVFSLLCLEKITFSGEMAV